MPLLDIHPRELKAGVYKSTCVQMFKAALLIMAQNWKKLKLASASKWINNEIGLSHKKEENTDSSRATDETSQHCGREAEQKESPLYISTCMSGVQPDRGLMSAFPGLESGRKLIAKESKGNF